MDSCRKEGPRLGPVLLALSQLLGTSFGSRWFVGDDGPAPRYVGICGQGPSDHPDLAKWLMEQADAGGGASRGGRWMVTAVGDLLFDSAVSKSKGSLSVWE